MTRRMRVARAYEKAQLGIRVVALAVEVASLGILSYLSVTFWYDHATNPIAYVGITIALMTDVAELFTLSTLDCGRGRRPGSDDDRGRDDGHSSFDNGWPQARLAWVALGDMTSAVLLFFSWIWLITRGMFWSCLVEAAAGGSSIDSSIMITRMRLAKRISDDDAVVYANCDGTDYPSEVLQKLSWILPFVMAAIHLITVMIYCSALQRRILVPRRVAAATYQ